MVTLGGGLILLPSVTSMTQRSITFHFEPSVAIIARKYDTLGHNLKDFRTPLRRSINEVIIPSIQMNFHKHGRPRWARLEENTVANKGGNMVPLQRSGRLMNTMKSSKLWTITRNTAYLADLPQSIWYGKVHQAGLGAHDVQDEYEYGASSTGRASDTSSVIGRFNEGEEGSIPPRPFVMIQPQDEDNIERVFEIWMEEQIIKAGLR